MASLSTPSAPTSPIRPNRTTAVVGESNNSTKNDDVVMEGNMLKRMSRLSKKYWQSRYFVFNGSDNTLNYYKQKGDGKRRGSFHVSDLTGTEVSDLFVQKHQKQLIYCIRIKFNNLDNDNDDRGGGMSDDEDDDDQSLSSREYSVGDAGGATGAATSNGDSYPPYPDENQSNMAQQLQQPTAPPSIPKPQKLHERTKSSESFLKFSPRRISKRAVSVAGRSVDNESLTFSSIRRAKKRDHRKSNSMNIPNTMSSVNGGDNVDNDEPPAVPESIQVASPNSHQTALRSGGGEASASTLPASNRTLHLPKSRRNRSQYNNEQEEEQDYLRSQYLTEQKLSQRRIKQKVTQGAQLAAAGAATVGVAFFTAGVGLVAGLVALGLAGSAVGGGAAVNTTWGRRRSTMDLVLASEDYETAKLWKSILDAALESDSLQRSTWGQLFAVDGRHARAALLPNRSFQQVLTRSASYNGDRVLSDEATSGKHGSPKQGLLFANNSRWAAVEGGLLAVVGSGYQGLRVFREEFLECGPSGDPKSNNSTNSGRVVNQLSVDGRPCPPMKAHTVISAAPLEAFLCLMSNGRVLRPDAEHRASFEVVESIDEHADIIHMVFRPLFLFPMWTQSRDFVLFRYWRLEPDGSYVVCFESVDHRKCPATSEHVRGEMHAVFTISPLKKSLRRKVLKQNLPSECLMMATVQVDPKGYVPTSRWSFLSNQAFGDAFSIAALLQLVDIRDAIDLDRFAPIPMDDDAQSVRPPQIKELRALSMPDSLHSGGIPLTFSNDTADDTLHEDQVNYDFSYACNESVRTNPETATGITSTPPSLTMEMWAEPDANSFRVRGSAYLMDKKKFNAGVSIGRLIAVDVVSVDKPIYSGFTLHPTERVQLALKKEAELKAQGQASDMPPFLFVVNIVLPGPPFFHGVYYYAVDDRSTIDGTNGTPSSKLCSKFFFGDSDDFRDRTFKLIPQIVQGNFIVRKAVGSTPAIMGKKLRQEYVRCNRFCEVILDCGSSAVATGVIRLSLGYAKSLVVDMGFLLEGDADEYLPERIFGSVRMKNIDFGPALRHVTEPPE